MSKSLPVFEAYDIENSIPEPILRASEAAGRRKREALDRLTHKLDDALTDHLREGWKGQND